MSAGEESQSDFPMTEAESIKVDAYVAELEACWSRQDSDAARAMCERLRQESHTVKAVAWARLTSGGNDNINKAKFVHRFLANVMMESFLSSEGQAHTASTFARHRAAANAKWGI